MKCETYELKNKQDPYNESGVYFLYVVCYGVDNGCVFKIEWEGSGVDDSMLIYASTDICEVMKKWDNI